MGRLERKKEKRKKFWTNVFLVAVFVLIVVGMTLGGLGNIGGNSELKYGKQKFFINNKYPNERYVTQINKIEIPFTFLPQETEYINLSSVVTNKIRESFFIMTTYDPNTGSLQDIARVNLYFSTFLLNEKDANKVVLRGVIDENVQSTLPVITCANATLQTPVLVFNVSDRTGIVDEGSCIYLNARGSEFIRLRDRLTYAYYGVIQDE